MPKKGVSTKSKLDDRETGICGRFRMLRETAGVTQQAMAGKLGIPSETLQSYEYCRAPIRFQLAFKILRFSKGSWRWLAFGEGQPTGSSMQISSDIARFVPPKVLFSTVAEKLQDLLEPLGARTLTELGSVKDHWLLPGTDYFIYENFLTDQRFLGLKLLARSLPRDSAEGFVEHLMEAAVRFLEDQDIRYDVVGGIKTSMLQTSAAVANRLGLDLSDIISAHDAFGAWMLDDGPPRTEHLSKESIQELLEQMRFKPEMWRSLTDKALGLSSGINHPNKRERLAGQEDGKKYLRTDTQSRNSGANHEIPMQTTPIAERIKAALRRLGLTQRQAAEKWGFSSRTLENWAQGRAFPRGLYLQQLEARLAEAERP